MDVDQTLKGIWDILYIFKGIRDTLINFRDIGIQSFLNFGYICHISIKDMGYKGVWDTGTPLPGPQKCRLFFV